MRAAVLVVAVMALTLGPSGAAIARRGVPVQNYDNVQIVRADGSALNSARVRQAIAGAAQRSKWTITEDAPGRIVATLSIRGKHSLTVEIRYTGTEFSINYRDSSNLNYAQGASGPVIHPTYNKQVMALLNAINADLRSV